MQLITIWYQLGILRQWDLHEMHPGRMAVRGLVATQANRTGE